MVIPSIPNFVKIVKNAVMTKSLGLWAHEKFIVKIGRLGVDRTLQQPFLLSTLSLQHAVEVHLNKEKAFKCHTLDFLAVSIFT